LIQSVKTYPTRNVLNDGWSLPVIFEVEGQVWRRNRPIIGDPISTDLFKNVANITVFDNRIKVSALGLHDGLGIEFGGFSGVLGRLQALTDQNELSIEEACLNGANQQQSEREEREPIVSRHPIAYIFLMIGVFIFGALGTNAFCRWRGL